jgi:hypothetical protein
MADRCSTHLLPSYISLTSPPSFTLLPPSLAALKGLKHLGVGDMTLELPLQLDPLTSITKLVTHNCSGSDLLHLCFPALKALSCDACDATLGDLSPMVRRERMCTCVREREREDVCVDA